MDDERKQCYCGSYDFNVDCKDGIYSVACSKCECRRTLRYDPDSHRYVVSVPFSLFRKLDKKEVKD